jgi:WD40-like Beta Propeller Repeat
MPSPLTRLAPLLLTAVSCKAGVIQVADLPAYHFGTPALVKELASSFKVENPTLTADSLQIFFTTNRNNGTNADVWFARRSAADEPFGVPEAIAAVNSDDRETSAAISADGLTLWFGSERPGGVGNVDIWVSERTSTSGD